MILNIFRNYLFIVGVLVLVSCGGGGGDSPPPDNTPDPTPTPTPTSTTGTVRLQNNNSYLSIHEFNLSPSAQSTWGPNQLSSVLLAGLYFDVTNVPIGTFDARARVTGLYSTYTTYLYTIPVTGGNTFTVYTTDSGYTGSLKIVNTAATASIIGLYVTPSSSSSWGSNQLSSPIAPSFGSMHLYDIFTGSHDVMIVWNDGGSNSYYFNKSILSLTLLTLDVI